MKGKGAVLFIILGILGIVVSPAHALLASLLFPLSIGCLGTGIVLLIANIIYPTLPKRRAPKF